MAAAHAGEPPPNGVLAHDGPWTEDAYLALPGGRRVELVDGSLLVAPSTGDQHDVAVAAVRAAVGKVLPEALEISGPVALRLSPGRILVPDLVIAARTDAPADGVRESTDALVVIDVVGRGNGVADRWFKPQLYAGSRIPYAVLIDHDDPYAVATMLIGGRYHEYAQADGDGVLRLEEPFALELPLADLAEPAGADGPVEASGETSDGPEPTGRGDDAAAPGTENREDTGPGAPEEPADTGVRH